MAQKTGTFISTRNPTLAHSSGRDGACSRSAPSLGRLPPPALLPHTHWKQGLVIMKPGLSPCYPVEYSTFVLYPCM